MSDETSSEMPDEIYAEITRLSEEGNRLSEAAAPEEALKHFRQAWQLLPTPREQWEAATWLLTAIGDVLFLEGNYTEALAPLQTAVRCPGGLGNPFLHLRLGQVQYELHNFARAKDELARAFMGG